MYTWKFKNEGRHNGPHLLILYLSFFLISVEMTLIIRYVLQIDFAIQAKRLIEI